MGGVVGGEVDGELWTLAHLVCFHNPRHYLHVLVSLDVATLRPLAASRPFLFRHLGVEYCLGAQSWSCSDEIQFFTSVWDRESWVGCAKISSCRELLRPLSDV